VIYSDLERFRDLQKVQSYPDRAFNVATIHGLLNVAVGEPTIQSCHVVLQADTGPRRRLLGLDMASATSNSRPHA
jgi:hypothetical protein